MLAQWRQRGRDSSRWPRKVSQNTNRVSWWRRWRHQHHYVRYTWRGWVSDPIGWNKANGVWSPPHEVYQCGTSWCRDQVEVGIFVTDQRQRNKIEKHGYEDAPEGTRPPKWENCDVES